MLSGEAVGVVAVGQEQQLDVHAFSQQHVDASFAGMNACIVAVEDDCDIFCDTMDEVDLVRCECCARRRYDVLDSLLVHGHHVGIAFNEVAKVGFADGLSCLEEAEEFLTLAVDDALRRVHVFDRNSFCGCVEHTASEASHTSACGEDGPDDSSEEAVSELAVFAFQAQSCPDAQARLHLVLVVHEIAFLVTFFQSRSGEGLLLAVGAVPNLELLQDVVPEASPSEIGKSDGTTVLCFP